MKLRNLSLIALLLMLNYSYSMENPKSKTTPTKERIVHIKNFLKKIDNAIESNNKEDMKKYLKQLEQHDQLDNTEYQELITEKINKLRKALTT